MDQITYNHGMVSELASDVGQRAAQLMEMHDDIQQRTNAIAEFFEGKAGTAFHEAQMQMLQGFQSLIQTVSRHGTTIQNVNEGAAMTDSMMAQGFGG
jgi:WXG100 family type VII secretion target